MKYAGLKILAILFAIMIVSPARAILYTMSSPPVPLKSCFSWNDLTIASMAE